MRPLLPRCGASAVIFLVTSKFENRDDVLRHSIFLEEKADIMDDKESYLTEKMRSSTREIHDMSDKGVNFHLTLVLTCPKLYGQALALFVPIYTKFESLVLESNHPELKKLNNLVSLLRRGKAMAKDVDHFLPESSERMETQAQRDYIAHLENSVKKNPVLLTAYVYHMYAALVAGGQIIARMVRNTVGGTTFAFQFPATDEFKYPKSYLRKLKHVLNEEMNFSGEEEKELLKESTQVFVLNNALVDSVKETKAWRHASTRMWNRVVGVAGTAVVCILAVIFYRERSSPRVTTNL